MSEIIYIGIIRPFAYKDSNNIFKQIKKLFLFKEHSVYFSESEENCLCMMISGDGAINKIQDYLESIKGVEKKLKKIRQKYKFSYFGQIFMGGIEVGGWSYHE